MQIRELDPYKFTNTNYSEDTPLDEETKKELLEIQNNIISPKKFHLNSLDSNLKEFFYRDKHYYLRIENMLKNSNSELEMIMKFLKILADIKGHQERYKIFPISLYIKPRPNVTRKDIICYPTNNISNYNFDRYKHLYPFQFNIRLYYIFKDFVNSSLDLEDYQAYKTIYLFDKFSFEDDIIIIQRILNYIKKLILKAYQENKSILDMMKDLKKNPKRGLRFDNIVFVRLSSNNKYYFCSLIDFKNQIDALQTKKEKLEFIDTINNIIEDLKDCLTTYNLNMLISNIKDYIKIEFQEPIIKYLALASNLPIITQKEYLDFSYFSDKKFYLELDFNMPKELVMKQIETLYKEYEKGNIQTLQEWIYNEKTMKKEQLETLNKQIDFKSLTSYNNPLYVVLTDFIYIIDMKLINMTDTHIYSRINDNRCHRYNNNKGFEMSYKKKYKKLVLDFYIQDKYNIYLS